MQTICQYIAAIEVSCECSFRAICCGGHYPVKSEAYVSTAIEVLHLKFIDDFICKASVVAQSGHGFSHAPERVIFAIATCPLTIPLPWCRSQSDPAL